MTKQEFIEWATGKLTDEHILRLVRVLNRSELLDFKNNWSE